MENTPNKVMFIEDFVTPSALDKELLETIAHKGDTALIITTLKDSNAYIVEHTNEDGYSKMLLVNETFVRKI